MKNTRRRRALRTTLAVLAAMSVTGIVSGLAPESPGPARAHATTSPTTSPATSTTTGPARVRQPQDRRTARPNVLVLNVDDMAVRDLRYLPNVRRHLVRGGTTMTEAIAPTPICVPSRASMLTGQYARNHGALTVKGPKGGVRSFDDRDTLPVWLRAAGYDTVFAGKYLNYYGVQTDRRMVPPGWDEWYASVDFSTYGFFGTTYNHDGRLGVRPQHNSDVLADFTASAIQRRRSSARPWFALVNFVAPHTGGEDESDDPPGLPTTTPARRHRDDMRRVGVPRGPEMFRGGGSPWAQRTLGFRREAVREAHQQRLESLLSVDEAVGRAMRTLRSTGQLARTYVVFTSDHGYLLGEHNKIGKMTPYDASLRVPMVVRGPGIARQRRLATGMSVADLPVTIAAIAGARPTRAVDGVNMLPYWTSRRAYDRPIPIEGWPVNTVRRTVFHGIRYGDLTYARRGRQQVLFDRSRDPGELRNFAQRRSHAKVLRTLRRWDRRFRACRATSCPQEDSFVPRRR